MDLKEKHILDATCGSRTIWFDKKCPAAIYFDCREEHCMAIWKSTKNDSVRTTDVEPDVIGDFTALPFDDASFELVVFDPPYLVHIGENAWLRKKYGKLPENWPQLIHDGFFECMRVLKPYGVLFSSGLKLIFQQEILSKQLELNLYSVTEAERK